MNDLASAKLCEIVAMYGPGVCDEPRRLRALLVDVCPGMPRQVNTLVAAAEQQIVSELRGSAATLPWNILSGRLVRRLVEETAMAEPDAQWVVASWGKALGRSDAVPASAPVPATPTSQPAPDKESGRRPVSSPPMSPGRSPELRLLIGVLTLAALAGAGYLIYRTSTKPRNYEQPAQPLKVWDNEKDRDEGENGIGVGNGQIPIETEIEHLREEASRLETDMNRHREAVAEQEVSTQNLRADIDSLRAKLEQQDRNIDRKRVDLKASNPDKREKLQAQLDEALASQKKARILIQEREELLQSKKEAVSAAKEQLLDMQKAHQQLTDRQAKLIVELRSARASGRSDKLLVDETNISRIRDQIEELQRRSEIERRKIEMTNLPAVAKTPELVVQIVGAPAAINDRWYRIGKEPLTLEEVKARLKKQMDGPNPSVQLRVVLFKDSPVEDSPVVNELLEWARANRFTTRTVVDSRTSSQP